MQSCLRQLASVLTALLLLGPAAAAPTAAPAAKPDKPAAGKLPALTWHRSIDKALTKASATYKPVFVLFTSPGCGWCRRLKNDALARKETRALLQHFELALIDIMEDRKTAATFRVNTVPRLFIMSSRGDIRAQVSGYLPPENLQKLLANSLNPKLLSATPAYPELKELLKQKTIPADKWPAIMLALGTERGRDELHDHIVARRPVPHAALITMLDDSRLAVRLGALEILEELTGNSFGFDPWLDNAAVATNREAVKKFKEHFGSEDAGTAVYAALTREQLDAYIRDLITGDRERMTRARRMLESGGEDSARALLEFLEDHEDLPAGARKRIKEMQYALYLPATGGIDPARTAHQLVFGNLDIRLRALAQLHILRNDAVPIIREYLDDPDPIVRETCIDTIVAGVERKYAVPMLRDHLKQEEDTEVRYAILKGLGNYRSRTGLKILTKHLKHKNEDLVIIAIQSIVKLKTRTAAKPLIACLEDPRWRVRVAALEAVGKLKLKTAADTVAGLLEDQDHFVRIKALDALTKLGSSDIVSRLKALFHKDDAMKAMVVKALVSLDQPLPKKFYQPLLTAKPDVALAALQALAGCQKQDLELVARFAKHKNPDCACLALRLLAAQGVDIKEYRATVNAALNNKNTIYVKAVLEGLRLPPELLRYEGITFRQKQQQTAEDSSNTNDDVFDAFLEEADDDAETPKKDDVSANDVFDDFLPAEDAAAKQQTADDSLQTTLDRVERLMQDSKDDDIRMAAALVLARAGSPAPLPFLKQKWNDCTADQKEVIVDSVRPTSPGVEAILELALNDSAADVRADAARTCWNTKRAEVIELVLKQLRQPKTRLQPHECYSWSVKEYVGRYSIRKVVTKWAKEVLAAETRVPVRTYALILIGKYKEDELLEPIRKSCTAKDPIERRAACHALASVDRDAFVKDFLAAVAEDPSEKVRLVIPGVYTWGARRWLHYFDEKNLDNEYVYNHNYNAVPKLDKKVETVLRKLTTDKSRTVRMESYFALLSCRKTVDLAKLVKTLDQFPDVDAVAYRVYSFLSEHSRRLGKDFALLLPYLERSKRYADDAEKYRLRLGLVEDEEDVPELTLVPRRDTRKVVKATLKESTQTPVAAPAATELKLVFFTSAGCSSCAHVKDLLAQLKQVFGKLTVETHDIKKIKAMRYNEALCERFNVPEKDRLVAPAVFGGGGYLIKTDITFANLGKLTTDSARKPKPEWDTVPEDELLEAEETIGERFATIGMVVIFAAGLLDGINPCAFATIIFLLSYLQIARRKPREIAQIGMAFIAGVFLAYFVLGLGLVEVVTRFAILQQFGHVVTWIVAAMALCLMVLSFRDGVLCLQGRLKDINLQLPGFLKERIHGVIRTGARHTHFVVAAFVIGVIISFLELACTGQVYAPTILYMLKTGQERWSAVGYLAIYNLAFVAPLFIIFILAYQGMTNESLRGFLEKRAATVKFATAGLFLVLFLVLVFGHRLGL